MPNDATDQPADAAGEWRFAFGGAVKATGPTTIEGLLVPYGSPDDLDADGEFFDARTDFGIRLPATFKLFYHHGMNAKVGRVPLAWAELERRDDGVYFRSDLADELDEWEADERAKAQKYRAVVLRMAKDGELGASSGAAAHVVVRQPAGKGARISRWPLAEASVTPTPANSRTHGTVTAKAMADLPDPLEAADECGECKARSLAAQTDAVTASVAALVDDYARLTVKAGRALSAARRTRLQAVMDALAALLSETDPRPRDAGASDPAAVMEAAEPPAPAQAADDSAARPLPLTPSAWPSPVEAWPLGA